MSSLSERPRIYLACPYSHALATVRAQRASDASKAAAALMQQGNLVYSPISMGHHICETTSLPSDFEFWREQDLSVLEHWATALAVLTLPGWQASVGVREEITAAMRKGLALMDLGDPWIAAFLSR